MTNIPTTAHIQWMLPSPPNESAAAGVGVVLEIAITATAGQMKDVTAGREVMIEGIVGIMGRRRWTIVEEMVVDAMILDGMIGDVMTATQDEAMGRAENTMDTMDTIRGMIVEGTMGTGSETEISSRVLETIEVHESETITQTVVTTTLLLQGHPTYQ